MASEQPSQHGGSTIQVTRREGRSLPMFLLHKVLRPLRSFLTGLPDPVSGDSQKVKLPRKSKQECDIAERQVNGMWIYDFTAKEVTSRSTPSEEMKRPRRKRVYYFNGGGWHMPASDQHVFLCSAIATRMPNTTISLVSYPLAPESPAPISFPQICDLYHVLLQASAQADETVILAGDSAGGNIVLCLPLYILSQDRNARVPTAIMAISPSTDLRRSNPEIEAVAKHDPLLTPDFIKDTANMWRGEWDAWDPRVSPLNADLRVLVERNVMVHGATGTYDILCPDAIKFRDKLAEAGVRGHWLEWTQQMHVWVLTARYGLPDAKKGIDWIAATMNEV